MTGAPAPPRPLTALSRCSRHRSVGRRISCNGFIRVCALLPVPTFDRPIPNRPRISTPTPLPTAPRPILAAVPQLSREPKPLCWCSLLVPHFVTHRSTASPAKPRCVRTASRCKRYRAADGSSASACRPNRSPLAPYNALQASTASETSYWIQDSQSSPVSLKPLSPRHPRFLGKMMTTVGEALVQVRRACTLTDLGAPPYAGTVWHTPTCLCLPSTALVSLLSSRSANRHTLPPPATPASDPRPLPTPICGCPCRPEAPCTRPGHPLPAGLPGLMAVTGPDCVVGRELSGQWLLFHSPVTTAAVRPPTPPRLPTMAPGWAEVAFG